MKRFSLILSYIFCVVGFLMILFMCAALPILGFRRIATVSAFEKTSWISFILSYAILILVLISDAMLFLLLDSIRKNRFFNDRSVLLLKNISWASIIAGFLAIPLFFLFIREALFISFIALFLGVVLRVFGQVIQRANEIK